jgi:predicted DNA-binding protein
VIVICTAAVYGGVKPRLSKMTEKRADKARKVPLPRASVTFPRKLYRTLEALAKGKKVSLAWVVREAAEAYVRDQSLARKKNSEAQL